MDGKNFLELAKKLQSQSDEASLRTSISRSYYAIFNHVKDFFQDNGLRLPAAAQAHVKACQYLLNSGIAEAQDLANDMENLREKRNHADYELRNKRYVYDSLNCGLVYVKAERFFDSFDKLDRSSLLNGIKEYKKKTNN